jgi:hypothetical protein
LDTIQGNGLTSMFPFLERGFIPRVGGGGRKLKHVLCFLNDFSHAFGFFGI